MFLVMVWHKFKEVQCTHQVLQFLHSETSTYTKMFRHTKVSHKTLQRVLLDLVMCQAIRKHDASHQKIGYAITTKGKKLLAHIDAAILLSK